MRAFDNHAEAAAFYRTLRWGLMRFYRDQWLVFTEIGQLFGHASAQPVKGAA